MKYSSTRANNLDAVRDWALRQFTLGRTSIHGPEHWERVQRNGLILAEKTLNADRIVVQLFAILHDCCRINEGYDPSHGLRVAEAAAEIRNELILLDDDQFNLLVTACRDHTDGYTTSNPTIACCWDADRLDLPRVGISPRRRFLSTAAAKAMVQK